LTKKIYHDRDSTKRVYTMGCELATDMQDWMSQIDNGIKVSLPPSKKKKLNLRSFAVFLKRFGTLENYLVAAFFPNVSRTAPGFFFDSKSFGIWFDCGT